jgi:hypothetical protein
LLDLGFPPVFGRPDSGQLFRLAYQLAWDEGWRLREARLVVTSRTRNAVAASQSSSRLTTIWVLLVGYRLLRLGQA